MNASLWIFFFVVWIGYLDCAVCEDKLAPQPIASVTAQFISENSLKPPMKSIRVKLVLTNSATHPVWFILPIYCDKPPVIEKRVDLSENFAPESICAYGFNSGNYHPVSKGIKGKAMVLEFWDGAKGEMFRLLRLPPNGRVEFEDFAFLSQAEYRASSFKAWILTDVLANGEMPLETWLPYPTTSDVDVLVPAASDWDSLNFDVKTLRTRVDFRQEKLKYLDLHIEGSLDVKLEGIRRR